jgi:hypothetical protein
VTLTGGTGGESGGSGAFITVNGGGPNFGGGGSLILSSGLESPGNYWAPGYNGAVIMAINGTEYMRVDGNRSGYQGNIGVGTSTPNSKFTVSGGDINVLDIGSGIIMKSPNGNCWKVTIDNSGAFVSTPITCP